MRVEPFNNAVTSKEKRTSGCHETLTPSLAPTPHTRPPADTFRHHSTKWRIPDNRFVTEMFPLVTVSLKWDTGLKIQFSDLALILTDILTTQMLLVTWWEAARGKRCLHHHSITQPLIILMIKCHLAKTLFIKRFCVSIKEIINSFAHTYSCLFVLVFSLHSV